MPDYRFLSKIPSRGTFATRSQLRVICHVIPFPIHLLSFLPLKFCVEDNANIEAMN